jgi:formylglycine-generating enzyme required for sulfatase activity
VRAFGLGVYDVTRGEFAQFVQETGYAPRRGCLVWTGKPFDQQGATKKDYGKNWRDPGYAQTDRSPVVCVSWDDAQAYIGWVNAKLGRSRQGSKTALYRLPTEAEWEYAARAGTATPFYWGAAISHDRANYGIDQCPPCGPRSAGGDRWAYTSPVGSFPPNAFGLYDMAGNVFQWLEDCWHKDYIGAPADGSAWVTGNCKLRIGRGGDWFDAPVFLRVAYRDLGQVQDGDYFSGFRLARNISGP